MKFEVTLASTVSELLREKGYCVKTTQAFKNGELVDTILVKVPNNTYYMGFCADRFVEQTASELVSYIEQALLSDNALCFSFDDPTFVLQHVYIGLQRTQNTFSLNGTDTPIIKRPSPFDGIDEYLFVRQTDSGNVISVTLPTSKLLESITDEDLWNAAYENTCRDTFATTIEGAIFDLTQETDSLAPFASPKIPLYVVTNHSKTRGAAAILNKQMILDFAKYHKVDKIVMLPSSIHEVIIKPYCEDNIDELTQLVRDINSDQVRPHEQLGDKAYLIDVHDYCSQ